MSTHPPISRKSVERLARAQGPLPQPQRRHCRAPHRHACLPPWAGLLQPQAFPEVLASLAPHVTERHLVISIAAGITLDTIETALGDGVRCIRVMPNTPALGGLLAVRCMPLLHIWCTEEGEGGPAPEAPGA